MFDELTEQEQNFSFVVSADKEAEARHMANVHAQGACGEGEIWDDEELAECEEIFVEGESEIILIRNKNG